jgi:hypothetical protein
MLGNIQIIAALFCIAAMVRACCAMRLPPAHASDPPNASAPEGTES